METDTFNPFANAWSDDHDSSGAVSRDDWPDAAALKREQSKDEAANTADLSPDVSHVAPPWTSPTLDAVTPEWRHSSVEAGVLLDAASNDIDGLHRHSLASTEAIAISPTINSSNSNCDWGSTDLPPTSSWDTATHAKPVWKAPLAAIISPTTTKTSGTESENQTEDAWTASSRVGDGTWSNFAEGPAQDHPWQEEPDFDNYSIQAVHVRGEDPTWVEPSEEHLWSPNELHHHKFNNRSSHDIDSRSMSESSPRSQDYESDRVKTTVHEGDLKTASGTLLHGGVAIAKKNVPRRLLDSVKLGVGGGCVSPSSPTASEGRTERHSSLKIPAFPDIFGLSSELGVPVRNLDEEPSESGNALASSAKSATEIPASISRWSFFRVAAGVGKKNTLQEHTDAPASGLTADGSVSKVSEDADLVSGCEQMSAVSNTDTLASPSDKTQVISDLDTTNSSSAQLAAQGRWFRLGGAKRTVSTPSSESTSAGIIKAPTAPPRSSSSSFFENAASSSTASKSNADLAAFDDFGQLEEFDSRRPASAAASSNVFSTGNLMASTSAIPDGNNINLITDEERETVTSKSASGWSFWNRQTASSSSSVAIGEEKGKLKAGSRGMVSEANKGETDLDSIFAAFDGVPSGSTSAGAVFDGSSKGMLAAAPVLNLLEDPYARLRTGSRATSPSRIETMSSAVVLDSFDPLAISNTAQVHIHTKRSTTSLKALAPPPSSASSTSRPPFIGLPPPPAPRLQSSPLLSPPPAALSRKSSPSSVLDDFADLIPQTVTPQSITMPASNVPVIGRIPQTMIPVSHREDDFGDFETFSPSARPSPISARTLPLSPKKMNGPMASASSPAVGSFNSGPSGRSSTPLSAQDLDFFDSL